MVDTTDSMVIEFGQQGESDLLINVIPFHHRMTREVARGYRQ
jgi:hypothetical protein